MSAGLNFIRKCIDESNLKIFRQVGEAYYLESELDAYRFVRDYVATYNSLPDVETISENNLNIPSGRRNTDLEYLAARVRDRKAYNHANEHFDSLRAAMEGRSIEEITDALRSMQAGIAETRHTQHFQNIKELTDVVIEDFSINKLSTGLLGITFGWQGLDAVTNGAQAGDVVALVGRPSMGKSWDLIYMANSAWNCGHNVGLISMEMTLKQIGRRTMGIQTGINPNKVRDGELSYHGERIIRNYAEGLEDRSDFIMMSGSMCANVSAIHEMLDSYSLDALYVDAAYLMTPEGQRNGAISKWEQISNVVKQLKMIADKHQIPVFITVQFNRSVKNNQTTQADLGDIGGTDAIAQDASIVLGMRKWVEPYTDIRRVIDVLKNREGETITIGHRFSFNPVNFDEVEYLEDEQEEDSEASTVITTDVEWME